MVIYDNISFFHDHPIKVKQFKTGNFRDKLSAVKADIESVERETGENMHTLVQMDRLDFKTPIYNNIACI